MQFSSHLFLLFKNFSSHLLLTFTTAHVQAFPPHTYFCSALRYLIPSFGLRYISPLFPLSFRYILLLHTDFFTTYGNITYVNEPFNFNSFPAFIIIYFNPKTRELLDYYFILRFEKSIPFHQSFPPHEIQFVTD